MADVNTLLSRSFSGVCRAGASSSALLTDGVIIPETSRQYSVSVVELAQASLNTGAAGKLFEHVFELRVPYAITLACRLRVKMRWVVNSAGSIGVPSDVTGRWSVNVTKRTAAGVNTTLTYPPTESFGVTQNMGNGTAGTQYEDDNLCLDIPANAMAAGETIRVVLSFYVVQPYAATTLNVGLRCNPAAPADCLVFEWDV